MAYRRAFRARSKRKTAPRKRKAPSKPKQSFTERVQAIVNKNIESKHIQKWLCLNTGVTGGGLAINTLTDNGIIMNNVLAQLGTLTGSTTNHRVGDKIHPTVLKIHGAVKSVPYSSTNTSNLPFEVHILFYKKKNDIVGSPNTIKWDVNRDQVSMDGSIARDLLPWNTNQFIIKKHLVRRLRPMPYVAASSNPIVGNYGDQSLPSLWRFNCTIPIKKELQYPHAAASNPHIPTNDWLTMGVYIIDGAGAALPISQVRAEASILGTLYYKDA